MCNAISKAIFLFAVCTVALTACGGGGSDKVPSHTTSISASAASYSISSMKASSSASSASKEQASSSKPITKEKLLTEISQLLDQEACAQVKPDNCEKVTVDFVAATLTSEEEDNPRVLIIDNKMSSLAFAGYRNRVLDLLTTDAEMNLISYRPHVVMPATVNSIFNLIKNYDAYLSVQDFAKFNNADNVKLFTLMNIGDGHGYYIAAFLLEHNPTAKFVFVESGVESKLYAPAEACSQLTSANPAESTVAVNLIKARYEHYLTSITKVISLNKINFVNASWGISRSVLSAIVRNVCNANASDDVLTQILAIDRQFIKTLASFSYQRVNRVQEISLIQAAAHSSRKLIVNDMDYLADCDPSIPNRIRVMDLMYAGENIPSTGTSNTEILSQQQLNSKDCVDVYIPLGQTVESASDTGLPGTRRQTMRTLIHGFFEFEMFPLISSPSLAAPVVLSSLINQQSKNPNVVSPSELHNIFLHDNFIHDPILHNQFDVFTLQYRSTAW